MTVCHIAYENGMAYCVVVERQDKKRKIMRIAVNGRIPEGKEIEKAKALAKKNQWI